MIKPLPGYVLIEPIEEESVSAGGVYVPETSKDKPMKGKVIAVGNYTKDWREQWCDKEKEFVLKSNVVIYKKWTNQEVQHKGKEYLLVHFNELLAVIE